MAQQPIAYARNPAYATGTAALLDYNTKEGQAIYKGATTPLTDRFDGEPANLKTFLDQVHDKATQYNWMPTLTLTVNNERKNLCEHYGEITRAVVQAAATTYLTAHDRNAQNSDQIFNCLRQSLTPEAYAKVANEKQYYRITVQGEVIDDGPCFLKALIDIAYTNTRSSAAVIRHNLSSLDTYMLGLKDSDIVAFHKYVKDNVNRLAAAGETTNDLLVNLFKAYKCAKDKNFLTWVQIKRDNWLEGTLPLTTNGVALMELAENYYKDSLARGDWLKLTKDQEKIIALEAQIREATKKDTEREKRKKKKKKGKKDEQEIEKNKKKWAWKTTPPRPGQKHTKVFEGRTYHWCPNHNCWTMHKPVDCKKKKEEENVEKESKEEEKTQKSNTSEKKKLKRLALQNIMELSSDDDESASN